MRASIALSDELRAILNEDGSVDLVSAGSMLHLEPEPAARLGMLLDGQASGELSRLLATLRHMRDWSPNMSLRRLAREMLRERP
jgi:hypothetical protein